MAKQIKKGFRKDLTGHVFGRLTVQGFSHSVRIEGGTTYSVWDCLCVCGNTKKVRQSNLQSGSIRSCGCWKLEIQQAIKQYSPMASVTHGCARTSLGVRTQAYKVWCWMKRRCLKPQAKDYKYYGALGVTVCERWMKFENFLADMGEPEAGLTIDRYPDNCGNYEPGNVRWATWEQQRANMRPKSFYIERAENSDMLKKILTLHEHGKTFRDIADILNAEGFLSPRGGIWWGGGIGAIVRRHEKDWI